MATNRTPEEWNQELRERVEDLARQLVLGESDGWEELDTEASAARQESVSAALRLISEAAAEAGCGEVERLSGGLLNQLGQTGPDSLAAGLDRLRQALTEEPAPDPEAAAAAPGLGQDPELLSEFVIESREHLANIENQLLALERDPENEDSLNSAFRGFHTIKGLAGFLDFAVIQEVAHEVETLLDLARNGKLQISSEVADVVLEGADFLKAAINNVDAGLQGKTPGVLPDHRELIARVAAAPAGGPLPASTAPAPAAEAGEIRDEIEACPDATAAPEPGSGTSAPSLAADRNGASSARSDVQAVKVNTSKLDHLVDMVGELVVAQSLLRHDPNLAQVQSPRLQRNLSQLSRITTDVQRTAMSMRMVPVGNLFRRMARLVRDLARKEGKRVELITSGDDTELDRNIVEELADPLMHMVRNAIGHGLETPAEREAAGKPAAGEVRLSSFHQSGFIVIELADDGRGLNREQILKKARERGLITSHADLNDHEVYSLIFEPGFSTAAAVNDVSGRGVGMDVVKRNILKLRGRVDIRSTAGKGTTFTLKVPLTLAIIEGLVVGVGNERYIVPIYTVREMLRPTAEALSTLQNRDEMVMVRGNLLPVVRLYRRFGVEPRSEDPTQCLLLVTENLGKRFCLLVDDLIGKQEVVIKSLGETLKNVRGVAGGAILGDGHVGLILDMDGLFGAEAGV